MTGGIVCGSCDGAAQTFWDPSSPSYAPTECSRRRFWDLELDLSISLAPFLAAVAQLPSSATFNGTDAGPLDPHDAQQGSSPYFGEPPNSFFIFPTVRAQSYACLGPTEMRISI